MTSKQEQIGELSDLVMDRFDGGLSLADAIEGVKSGRGYITDDVWESVEKRCTILALERHRF